MPTGENLETPVDMLLSIFTFVEFGHEVFEIE